MFCGCLTKDGLQTPLSKNMKCVLALYCVRIIFKGIQNFKILPNVLFSHPVASCFIFGITKRSSSYCMSPLSSPLYLINTVHALENSVDNVSSIHQVKLPGWYFPVLDSLGYLQCRKCLWFSWGDCLHARNPNA